MSSRKPTLVLTTPVSATFPAEALKSAASVRTPHSVIWRDAMSSAGLPSAGLPSAGLSSAALYSPLVTIKIEEGLLKTPISPPPAYTDFLKMVSPVLPSPSITSPISRSVLKPNDKESAEPEKKQKTQKKQKTEAEEPEREADVDTSPASTSSSTPTSATATSARSSITDCSACDYQHYNKSPKVARIDTSLPPPASPFGHHPMSAPAMGRTTFPSLAIPPISPAASHAGGPRADPLLRSPFSARSVVSSPFDWEANKCSTGGSSSTTSTCTSAKVRCVEAKSPASASTRTSVRHIREVITRTVTYTPRMNPAPKGKKRKAECSGAACS